MGSWNCSCRAASLLPRAYHVLRGNFARQEKREKKKKSKTQRGTKWRKWAPIIGCTSGIGVLGYLAWEIQRPDSRQSASALMSMKPGSHIDSYVKRNIFSIGDGSRIIFFSRVASPPTTIDGSAFLRTTVDEFFQKKKALTEYGRRNTGQEPVQYSCTPYGEDDGPSRGRRSRTHQEDAEAGFLITTRKIHYPTLRSTWHGLLCMIKIAQLSLDGGAMW